MKDNEYHYLIAYYGTVKSTQMLGVITSALASTVGVTGVQVVQE